MNAKPDRRLLVIGLDAFDPIVAAEMMREGRLPVLAALERSAARFSLDHGIEKYTGLAWEQFATGRAPEEAERWSACHFDSDAYAVDQPPTALPPFAAGLDARTVVFDAPYFDLTRAPAVRGMVGWGAHDPGVPTRSNPGKLVAEIEQRFGAYPATKYIYGHVWPSRERSAAMARAMIEAVECRAAIARWLFAERLPDWDLAMVVVSEYHSAIEALWHGWDKNHPLHACPSSEPARAGIVGVYEAADRMIGEMIDAFPDARVLAFSPHGMGRNLSDPAAMVLVPELFYRHYMGLRGLTSPPAWHVDGSVDAAFGDFERWSGAIFDHLLVKPRPKGFDGPPDPAHPFQERPQRHGMVGWMPATRYRVAWPMMKAFALPAYYDARIRVNLKGREGFGQVALTDYGSVIDEAISLIGACRDPRDGAPLAIEIERRPGDPMQRHPSDADLVIRFARDHYAFDHPRLGRIGPVPCRRSGGHSGGAGIGYLTAAGRTGDVGRFPTLEICALVRALAGDRSAHGDLVSALGNGPG